jgi:adenosylcobinamide-phosphate synthase
MPPTFSPTDLLLAWALDAVFGDPRWIPWPHPVVAIGRGVTFLDGVLYRTDASPVRLVCRGLILWVGVVLGTAVAGWTLLAVASWAHPLVGRAAAIYVAYACLATRCLDAEARAVAGLLRRAKVPEARRRLSRIVGRDTEGLSRPEIVRATVETVAENTSDAVVAPLFYLALGAFLGWGPMLGLAYKAINTLDSMVGYRDERHQHFGKVSAVADDLANWIPARVTVVVTAVAAQVLWRRGRACTAVAVRDGRLHRSPNAGYPEAAFAGALGVSLGGTNSYRGVDRASPRIGDPSTELNTGHVYRSLGLLWGGSVAMLLFAAGWLTLS